MKKNVFIVLLFMSWALSAKPFISFGMPPIEYHVDPIKGTASALANGTFMYPFKTIQQAQEMVRANNKNMASDIIVYLHAGTYELAKTLTFTEADGGNNGFTVIYKAYKNEKPQITGGKPITGWKAVSGKGYYKANVATSEGYSAYMRNIFINGKRAIQARSAFITAHNCNYDDPKTPQFRDGVFVKTSDIKKYTNVSDIYFFQCGAFKHIEIPVLQVVPVTPTESALVMKQPSFYNWTNTYTYYSVPTPEPIQLINAFEELDEPGEFYHDRKSETIYYYPRKNENLKTAQVIAPAVETLLKIEGASNSFINNLKFEGISFAYGNWTTWATKEIGRSQADLYADYTSIEGQIQLRYTNNVTFKGCRFEHLLGSGIYLPDNNNRTTIQGNVFNDLTAAAVLIGKDQTPSAAVNNHTLIDNNVIRTIGVDFYQASGIYANASNNLTITHNDVADIAYFGINQRYSNLKTSFVGNTQIKYNKVTNYATAAKYGFGISDEVGAYYFYDVQNSVFANNYGEYLGNKSIDGCFREDAGGINNKFINNVANCKASKKSFSFGGEPNCNLLFDNNYANVPDKFTNIPGCTNTNFHLEPNAPFTTKWSREAQAIIDSAGLQANYKFLLSGFGPDVYDSTMPPTVKEVPWSNEFISYLQSVQQPLTKDVNLFWTTFGHSKDLSKQNNGILIQNASLSTKAVFRGGFYDNKPIRFNALFKDTANTYKELSFRVPYFSWKNLSRYYFNFTNKELTLKRVNADLSTTTLIGKKGIISEAIKYTSNLYTTGSNIEIQSQQVIDGVKIVLFIDGVKWVDCLDATPGYLTNPGFWMVETKNAGGSILLREPIVEKVTKAEFN